MTEYIYRQRLSKIGMPLAEDLDCMTAECFVIIGSEIDVLQDQDVKKQSKKGKRK